MWTPLQYMGKAATGTPVASVLMSNHTRLRNGRDFIHLMEIIGKSDKPKSGQYAI